MTLGDLKGKRLYDLNPEEFEEQFCRYCRENEECLPNREGYPHLQRSN